MTPRLAADFEKRHAGGMTIAAAWDQPLDEFQVTVLFGASGCGKTTILRCLAGLDPPSAGQIRAGDEWWFDARRRIHVPVQRRDVGFLFQEYALFPHRTIAGNVGYGLRHLPSDQRRQRVQEVLASFQLQGLEKRYPHQVSGGQQQRAALARVLVRRPRLLLLDEPLSALDTPTREQIRQELRERLREFRIPVVLVTHDRLEAMALADRILVLHQGRVRQQGTIAEVFSRPADLIVAQMVGMETIQEGRVVAAGEGLLRIQVARATLSAIGSLPVDTAVFVGIRGEEVVLLPEGECVGSARNRLEGHVTSLQPEGPLVRVYLDCGFPLTALVTRPACEELGLAAGSRVSAAVKAQAIHVMRKA